MKWGALNFDAPTMEIGTWLAALGSSQWADEYS
jgi:hypothetical protein